MKTTFVKFAIAGLLSLTLIIPKYGFSQNDQQDTSQEASQQYGNPPDNPPDSVNQQLDQQESQQAAPPDSQPVNTQFFYDQLSPYGQWVNYGTYGYVWIPSAGPNFVPYSTEGHWVYTTYGWTWVSDYSWGWAVFHYGRWAYDNNYGWFWIPGVTWGPAWVAWRHSEGYYGWAPLYPGIDITVSYDWWVNIPVNYWCFVYQRYIGDRYVWRHYEPRAYNATYIRSSTIITNTYYDPNRHMTYAAGPQREEVERALHTTIRPVPVHESNRPEQRYDQAHLHLYRPNVSAPAANEHPAPQRAVDIKQVPQRNVQYVAPRQAPQQQQQQRQQQYQQPRQQQARPQYQQPRQQTRQAPSQSRGYGGGGYGGGGGKKH